MNLADGPGEGSKDVDGDGVVAGANLDEELGEVFKFGDEVVVYFFDIEEDVLDCFYLFGLVELFEGEVHALGVVDRYFLQNFVHVFFLVLGRIELLHVGQSEDLGQPDQEQLEGDEFDDVAEGVNNLVLPLEVVEELHYGSHYQLCFVGFVAEGVGKDCQH